MAASLAGYWAFDEGAGPTAHDSTWYGNPGAIIGATWDSEGISGSELWFDGAGLCAFHGIAAIGTGGWCRRGGYLVRLGPGTAAAMVVVVRWARRGTCSGRGAASRGEPRPI